MRELGHFGDLRDDGGGRIERDEAGSEGVVPSGPSDGEVQARPVEGFFTSVADLVRQSSDRERPDARAGGDAGTDATERPARPLSGSGGGHERPTAEMRAQYPGEYIEPDVSPEPGEPFADPREFAPRINPRYGSSDAGYTRNCLDCARAVEATWRGRPEVAAGLADPDAAGERLDRTERWYGRQFAGTGPAEVASVLRDAGPGSSAVVEVQYQTLNRWGVPVNFGHAFNAVNLDGEILLVDGQVNQVEPWADWPPPGWDPSTRLLGMRYIGWDAEGGEI